MKKRRRRTSTNLWAECPYCAYRDQLTAFRSEDRLGLVITRCPHCGVGEIGPGNLIVLGGEGRGQRAVAGVGG